MLLIKQFYVYLAFSLSLLWGNVSMPTQGCFLQRPFLRLWHVFCYLNHLQHFSASRFYINSYGFCLSLTSSFLTLISILVALFVDVSSFLFSEGQSSLFAPFVLSPPLSFQKILLWYCNIQYLLLPMHLSSVSHFPFWGTSPQVFLSARLLGDIIINRRFLSGLLVPLLQKYFKFLLSRNDRTSQLFNDTQWTIWFMNEINNFDNQKVNSN